VLVGLREHGSARKQKPGHRAKQGAGRWTALGFTVAPKLAGSPAVADPLLFSVPLLPPVWSSDTGSRAVALAEQFLGVPYQWGGASPLTGFDCSGLTRYVYGQLGIELVHYAASQIREGYPVGVQGLMPGDLVFFDPGLAGPGHVGIYAGNGMFIHAPHTGDVVKISPLSSYAPRYVGAVRPYRGA
jgi:cell wall-associated NlpC family hydrolase